MVLNRKIVYCIAVICILLILNAFFIAQYFFFQGELEKTRETVKVQSINEKVISFLNLFITKVLKSDNEVSFEDRLIIENLVRDIGSKEILDQWQKFTESKTEQEAQNEVKNLLEVLVENISY
ncbi:MAG: hypothetical protein HYT35_01175 [Candidatus Staskawiczbacteria bacterium]|nr:hypothetical protein [Candidatus Staskawiczbacteria bacterium]